MNNKVKRRLMAALLSAVMLLGLAGSARAMTMSVQFEASDAILSNPFIGNVVWANTTREREQDFTLVYADLTWAELEPEKGFFDFESIELDNNFDYWREQGKHVVLRFMVDMPDTRKHMDIPQWLYDETDGDGEIYNISYGRGYNPNYENKKFIAAHARAIAALGKRYDGDPLVAFVELGSLGHWGEWHVHNKLKTLPLTDVRAQYVQHYVDAFSNTKLMMRRSFTHALEHGTGLFNDMAGDPAATEEWLGWIESGGDYWQTGELGAIVPMPDAWRSAPIGGEMPTSVKKEKLLDAEFERTLALFERSHASWVGPGSFADIPRDGKLQANLDTLLNTLGYRLRVERMDVSDASSDTLLFALTWQNDGIAPFYFDWIPCLRITGSGGVEIQVPLEGNLSDIQPDNQVVMNASVAKQSLPKGWLDISVGIIDPASGEAGVQLAMRAAQENRWYHLMQLIAR